jgi:hypothetical protein
VVRCPQRRDSKRKCSLYQWFDFKFHIKFALRSRKIALRQLRACPGLFGIVREAMKPPGLRVNPPQDNTIGIKAAGDFG